MVELPWLRVELCLVVLAQIGGDGSVKSATRDAVGSGDMVLKVVDD